MNPFLVCLIVFAAAHLIGEALKSMPVRYITKPFLMPSLALYYITSAVEVNWLVIAALVCGWLGDIFLMIPDPEKTRIYFRPGLVAFLLGHVFYIIVFGAFLTGIGSLPWYGYACFVVFLASGLFGAKLLLPHAGAMRGPILGYIVIIVLMGFAATLPLGSALLRGAVTVVLGAFVFIVSDTINAYNKFVKEIPYERLYTMSTYLAGQFLLVQGCLWL